METETKVKITGAPIFGDPSPVLTTIFATLCYCFWANTMGFFGEGAVLAIGVLQLAVFASYTIGGVILLRNGNSFGGNMFMVFATVFGGIGVLCYGLTGAGLAPEALNELGAWALLIDGLVGFYTVVGQMLAFGGLKPLPLGKPFLTKK